MEKFSKTLLVFDADTIINKNLADYIELNRNIDITISIKKSNRYFHLTISQIKLCLIIRLIQKYF